MAGNDVNQIQNIANGLFTLAGGVITSKRVKGLSATTTGAGVLVILVDAGLGVDLGGGTNPDELVIRLTGQIGAGGTRILPTITVAPALTGGAGANQLIFTVTMCDMAAAGAATDGTLFVEVGRAY